MDTEDLMTKDWVSFRGKPVRIEEISRPKQRVSVATNRMVASPKVSEIEPIPLTPEILEKNGFQVTYPTRVGPTFGPKWDIREKKFSIHIEFAGNGTACLEIHNELAPKNEYGAADLITYCRDWAGELYVHELQHALRLCGIEKEIVL